MIIQLTDINLVDGCIVEDACRWEADESKENEKGNKEETHIWKKRDRFFGLFYPQKCEILVYEFPSNPFSKVSIHNWKNRIQKGKEERRDGFFIPSTTAKHGVIAIRYKGLALPTLQSVSASSLSVKDVVSGEQKRSPLMKHYVFQTGYIGRSSFRGTSQGRLGI